MASRSFYTTSDPTQALIEHEHMLLAITVEFAMQARVANPRATPADLHKYMLARAAQAPLAAKAVEYCRLVEMLLMFRDAERNNDFAMYQLVSSMALGFGFAVTNCYNYVRCMCERLLRWGVASRADMIVYTELTFTMTTRWGKRIYADRWFEHVQKMIRAGTGRLWNPFNHKRIMRIASDVPAFAASRLRNVRSASRAARADSSAPGHVPWHKSWMAQEPGPPPGDAPLFCPSVAFRAAQRLLRNSCIAGGYGADGKPTGLGAPLRAKARDGSFRPLKPLEYVSAHSASEQLCAEGLLAPCLGPERVRAYALRWYVRSRHVVQREGEHDHFSHLEQYQKPVSAKGDFLYARDTTTDLGVIMHKPQHGREHFMTIDYMRAELEAFRARKQLPADMLPARLPPNKAELAKLLVAARKHVYMTQPAPTKEEFLASIADTFQAATIVASGDDGWRVRRGDRELDPLAAPLLALPGLPGVPLASRLFGGEPRAAVEAHPRRPASRDAGGSSSARAGGEAACGASTPRNSVLAAAKRRKQANSADQ